MPVLLKFSLIPSFPAAVFNIELKLKVPSEEAANTKRDVRSAKK